VQKTVNSAPQRTQTVSSAAIGARQDGQNSCSHSGQTSASWAITVWQVGQRVRAGIKIPYSKVILKTMILLLMDGETKKTSQVL
jgi:hypothetical protein